MSAEPADTYHAPEHGWTCWHCGETFKTVRTARDHFGGSIDAEPGCMIRVQAGEERGLLMALRAVEAENARLRNDIEGEVSSTLDFHIRLEAHLNSYPPFRGCRSVKEVFDLYDSMEGRALAAEERLAALAVDHPRATSGVDAHGEASGTQQYCPSCGVDTELYGCWCDTAPERRDHDGCTDPRVYPEQCAADIAGAEPCGNCAPERREPENN